MLNIIDMLLTNHNRPGKMLLQLKGIVVHCTGSSGPEGSAVEKRNLFNTTSKASSTHYIVDKERIVRCLPDNEVGYHVGARRYTKLGQGLVEDYYSPNFFLIGVTMCVSSGEDRQKVYQNGVTLIAYLMRKYGLNADHLFRHFDVTGKDCPKGMLDEQVWNEFKVDVTKELLRVKLVIDGQLLDIPITFKEGTIYASVKPIVERLNARISWNQDLHTVFIDSEK